MDPAQNAFREHLAIKYGSFYASLLGSVGSIESNFDAARTDPYSRIDGLANLNKIAWRRAADKIVRDGDASDLPDGMTLDNVHDRDRWKDDEFAAAHMAYNAMQVHENQLLVRANQQRRASGETPAVSLLDAFDGDRSKLAFALAASHKDGPGESYNGVKGRGAAHLINNGRFDLDNMQQAYAARRFPGLADSSGHVFEYALYAADHAAESIGDKKLQMSPQQIKQTLTMTINPQYRGNGSARDRAKQLDPGIFSNPESDYRTDLDRLDLLPDNVTAGANNIESINDDDLTVFRGNEARAPQPSAVPRDVVNVDDGQRRDPLTGRVAESVTPAEISEGLGNEVVSVSDDPIIQAQESQRLSGRRPRSQTEATGVALNTTPPVAPPPVAVQQIEGPSAEDLALRDQLSGEFFQRNAAIDEQRVDLLRQVADTEAQVRSQQLFDRMRPNVDLSSPDPNNLRSVINPSFSNDTGGSQLDFLASGLGTVAHTSAEQAAINNLLLGAPDIAGSAANQVLGAENPFSSLGNRTGDALREQAVTSFETQAQEAEEVAAQRARLTGFREAISNAIRTGNSANALVASQLTL